MDQAPRDYAYRPRSARRDLQFIRNRRRNATAMFVAFVAGCLSILFSIVFAFHGGL